LVNILFDCRTQAVQKGTLVHQLVGYHRPASIGDALTLLSEPHRVAYAGGTTIHHNIDGEPVEVVDLQAIGLGGIEVETGSARIGATTTLQELVDHDELPRAVRDAARAELPSTLRSLATVGGTIGAAESHSLLLAMLLVHDAEVRFADGPVEPLAGVLARRVASTELVVSVEFATTGTASSAGTGRTPADIPIVAAAARIDDDGFRLALCGVADVPVLVRDDEIAALQPPSDFRGSSSYRRQLAAVLAARVAKELS
jgi:CO/xanthine dehydrogenase FAD-binding subunit